jgi:hypothetical protein
MKNFLIISLVGLSFLSSCREKCTSNVYYWEIPTTFSPAKDTFNIGDTITISSKFNDMVYERYEGKDYKLVNYKFFPECKLIQIDSVPTSEQELAGKLSTNADLIVDSIYVFYLGEDANKFEVARGNYNYWDKIYRLEYKLVLKKSGLFLFNHSSNLNEDILNGQAFDGRCPNSEELGKVLLNNGSSNNVEMLHDGYDTYEGGYIEFILRDPQKLFHDKGGYVFYVKE